MTGLRRAIEEDRFTAALAELSAELALGDIEALR